MTSLVVRLEDYDTPTHVLKAHCSAAELQAHFICQHVKEQIEENVGIEPTDQLPDHGLANHSITALAILQ